ncbi:hemerythrin domain-containing protein [Streptacidiphilus rugosus]|uniref:hemerythrin domain-containing protein n=1 Tax=Streptacidiphilus rugosus TaxID=405783 RepID=UPI00068AEDDB|nr:hemerythrin domain-containing protein [Streptacidiphilus rugosus]
MIETNIARDRAEGDLLDVLAADHEDVTRHFSAFLGTPIGDPERKELMDTISALLVSHAAIEEALLYPHIRERAEDGAHSAVEGLDVHAHAEVLLRQIAPLDAHAPGFDRLVAVLDEHVSGHMHWEEARLFPMMRAALSQGELDRLGDEARAMRSGAPTAPQAHPGMEGLWTDDYRPPGVSAADRLRRGLTPAGGWDRMKPH